MVRSQPAPQIRLPAFLIFSLLSLPGLAGLGTIQSPSFFAGIFGFEPSGEFEAIENPAEPSAWPVTEGQSAPDTGRRGETIMKALAAAYPDRVGPAEPLNGDWTVVVAGVRFYYALGRLLPEDLRDQAGEYDPQTFYSYPEELPPWQEPDQDGAERLQGALANRQAHPPKRSQHFFDALWRAHTREESYERVKTIRFLGRNILVHYAIMEELALVEEQILNAAKADTQVRQWINSLESISTWNWRNIANTQSRSYHAYGAALDLLAPSRRGMETYWQWTAEKNSRWWAVPYEKRLHPPAQVIKAFEAYGFIWGGKWRFYDTMHFEYRPEILLLNGIGFTHS